MIKIKVEIECIQCECQLDATVKEDNTIQVDICTNCLSSIENERYRDGHGDAKEKYDKSESELS